MITRRQVIGGLGGIIAASRAPYARCNWAMDFDEEFARATTGKKAKLPYVTDGLIAMWDGEWNAGFKVHDPEATVWKDLVGTNHLSVDLDIAQWGADYIQCNSGVNCVGNHDYADIAEYTEFVVKDGGWSNSKNYISIGGNMGLSYFWYEHYCPGGRGRRSTPDSGAGVYESHAVWRRVYIDQVNQSVSVDESDFFVGNYYFPAGSVLSGMNIGVDASTPISFRSIRIYNRNLSAEEIAQNHAIDKARFGL